MAAITSRHLPATDDTRGDHWTTRAACKGASMSLFFPTRANCADAYLAKRFCDACPVRSQCLNEGIENPRSCGVWGGHYFDDGKHRPIGEPDPYRTGGANRSQLAAARRRDALQQFHTIRAEHPSDVDAFRALAAHYGVTEGCARDWIRMARAEAAHAVEEQTATAAA